MVAQPSIDRKAFQCPRCDAYADQTWFKLFADEARVEGASSTLRASLPEITEKNIALHRFESGPFIAALRRTSEYVVTNAYLSRCASCRKTSVWVADRLIYPESTFAPLINPDTPREIAADYAEAASILRLSPRGSAALLRLAIQKLCAHLGEPGKNINDDIASLVRKGLDPRIQKALDALRVIGNEAVHPGTIDLNDKPETAESLFRLFNLIVEKMISDPKHVDEVYALLPADKVAAIEKRDKEKGA